MTYQNDFTLPGELLEQIATEGFSALPEMIHQLIIKVLEGEWLQYLKENITNIPPNVWGRRMAIS